MKGAWSSQLKRRMEWKKKKNEQKNHICFNILFTCICGGARARECVSKLCLLSTNETHDKRSPGRNSRYSGHRTRECSMNLHDAVVVVVFHQTHNVEDTQQQKTATRRARTEKNERKNQNIGKNSETHLETEKSR